MKARHIIGIAAMALGLLAFLGEGDTILANVIIRIIGAALIAGGVVLAKDRIAEQEDRA